MNFLKQHLTARATSGEFLRIQQRNRPSCSEKSKKIKPSAALFMLLPTAPKYWMSTPDFAILLSTRIDVLLWESMLELSKQVQVNCKPANQTEGHREATLRTKLFEFA